jgi:hypothetical protein
VEEKKWTSVEHYHRAGSNCSEVYSVRGVPHVMLVDQDGVIVFKGHPATRKLEEDLDALSKGEKLTGEGIKNEPDAPSTEEEKPKAKEGFKEIDLNKANAEVDDFKKFCENLKTNESFKAAAEKVPRAFNVLVIQT